MFNAIIRYGAVTCVKIDSAAELAVFNQSAPREARELWIFGTPSNKVETDLHAALTPIAASFIFNGFGERLHVLPNREDEPHPSKTGLLDLYSHELSMLPITQRSTAQALLRMQEREYETAGDMADSIYKQAVTDMFDLYIMDSPNKEPEPKAQPAPSEELLPTFDHGA